MKGGGKAVELSRFINEDSLRIASLTYLVLNYSPHDSEGEALHFSLYTIWGSSISISEQGGCWWDAVAIKWAPFCRLRACI